VFSRVHVDDTVSGVIAAFDAPPGAYNLADDLPCSQNFVIEEACRLLGVAPPPLQSLDEARLGFEAKRVLGWRPAFPTYREGLLALSASTIPSSARTAPAPASQVQR
jgi:nucleoside-diphosphate-sugar epimerase